MLVFRSSTSPPDGVLVGAVISLLALSVALLSTACGPAQENNARASAGAGTGEAEEAYTPRPEGTITWASDVASIVHQRCAPCHHPGGPGPYPLLSYKDLTKNARQVGEVTRSRYMPPWLPQMPHGTFVGERHLSTEQLGILQQWLREGLKPGDLAQAPPPPGFEPEWPLGPPDLIVEMPKSYTLPEAGRDVFRNFVIPITNKTLRWVRAIDLQPNNPRVIHHATMWIDRTGTSRRVDAEDPEPGYPSMDPRTEAQNPDGHFLGWTPGTVPYPGRNDLAWRLDPGTDLLLQLHMLPTGRPEGVRCLVGFYFSDEAPQRTPSILRLGSRTLDIPAGDSEYRITDSFALPVAAEILAVRPHAHYLGRRFEAIATLPDGSRETLLTMPWDFTWQEEYHYTDPPRLPAGTVINAEIVYDNSEENVDNPSYPPQRVRYGPLSADEMGDLWFQVLTETPADRVQLEQEFAKKELAAGLAGLEVRRDLEPENADVRIELGIALELSGEIEAAIDQFEEALKLEPDHATALNNLGSLHQRQGSLASAERYLRQAVTSDPLFSTAYYNLGAVLLGRGDLKGAERSLREGLKINPGNAIAQNNLGVVLERQGRSDRAIEPFSRAVAMRPDYVEARYNLGLAHANLGDLERAEEQFRRAIDLAPELVEAHFSLGFIALQRGDLSEAEARFRSVLAIDPNHANAREGLRVVESQRSSG